ncbi:MAG: type II toxin-antitoxin system RelE/ParE family toxin [bacterium]|nr:type II toxin-antitoxin system RelE/ParE family toxin [bacterium]
MIKTDHSKYSKLFLKKLLPKHAKQVAEKIVALAEDPRGPDCKELIGYKGFWRSDSGEYRIIYRMSATVLFVMLVGKRNDDEIYKRFKRKAP